MDYKSLLLQAKSISNPIEALIAQEAAALIASDAKRYPLPNGKVTGNPPSLDIISDDLRSKALAELESEFTPSSRGAFMSEMSTYYQDLDKQYPASDLPTYLSSSSSTVISNLAFQRAQAELLATAEADNKLEKKLALHLGGYIARQKNLKNKTLEVYKQIEEERAKLDSFRNLQINEDGAILRRLESLREDVSLVSRREREEQEAYRAIQDELRSVEDKRNGVNGVST